MSGALQNCNPSLAAGFLAIVLVAFSACRDPLTDSPQGTQTEGSTTSTTTLPTTSSQASESTAVADESSSNTGVMKSCPSDTPGELLWRTSYPATYEETTASSLAINQQGDSFVVGQVDRHFWVGSYDSDGRLNWSDTPEGHLEDGHAIVTIDRAGDVVAGGNTLVDVIDPSMVQFEQVVALHKYDPSGELLWALELPQDEPHAEYIAGLQARGNGELLVLTIADIEYPNIIRLWQVSGDGTTASSMELPDGQLEHWLPSAFVIPADDSIIVVGQSQPERLGWAARVTLSGETLWSRTWPELEGIYQGVTAIQPIGDDQYLVAGRMTDPGGGTDVWLVQIDSLGNTVQEMTLGEPGVVERAAVTVDADANLLLAGGTYPQAISGVGDGWVRKYDADGILLWHTDLEGNLGASSVAIHPSCGIVIAGRDWEANEIYVAKLSP